ncbi:MAG TPA: hypothetical protein VJP02_10920 [Candidatus Sulfotelmatobacter sp.]|nr:hypothetical protein [Candidatus Sulfotelmatobacter sp.]
MAPILPWLILVLCLLIPVVKYLMGIILRFTVPSAKLRKEPANHRRPEHVGRS